jgi:hypothetical protein
LTPDCGGTPVGSVTASSAKPPATLPITGTQGEPVPLIDGTLPHLPTAPHRRYGRQSRRGSPIMAKKLSDTMTAALRERWVQRQEMLHDIGESPRDARQAVEKRAEPLA